MKIETLKIRLEKGDKKKIIKRAKDSGFFQIRNGKKEVNMSEYSRKALLGEI